MSRDKKDIKEAINQLEKLRFHCETMSNVGESEEWKKDTKALDLAIEVLKKELYSEKANIITIRGAYRVREELWDDRLKETYKDEALYSAFIELRKSKAVHFYKTEHIGFTEVRAELDVVKKDNNTIVKI